MYEIVRGTVQSYYPDKGYGFVNADNGERVFFHASGRGGVSVRTSTTPRFEQTIMLELVADCRDIPKRGDRLCFYMRQERRGLQADPWAFERMLRVAQAELIAPVYRVVRHRKVVVKGKVVPTSEAVFEGSLDELDLLYPIPCDREDDPLTPVKASLISVVNAFEINLGDGWESCSDPRHSYYSVHRTFAHR